MPNFNRIVEVAKAVTINSDLRFKHVAIIMKRDTILAIATNHSKSHPRTNKPPYTFCGERSLHAEMAVTIRYGKIDCSGLTIIICRIRSNGQLGLSLPCSGCQHLIKQLNFKKCFYSSDLQTFEEL